MATSTAAPPQHGLKLAVHVITSDFGNLVAKVCECLLRRGSLSKAQISKYTELNQDKVKKCLWVLIQHNCVQAFALEQEGGARETTLVVTQYMALFNNIIHRLRFPKFMSIVAKEQDKNGLGIFEGLLHHGRLTLTQVLDRAADFSKEGSNGSQDTNRDSFIKLVHSRFVERCPAAEPLISLPSEDEAPPKKNKYAKFARAEVTVEERALAAAIPMDAERFSIFTDDDVDFGEDKSKSNVPSVKVGDKRKKDSSDFDNEPDSTGGKKEPVWRVNFDEFINRLRKKACVEYAQAEYDISTAVILKSMLEGTKSTEDTVSLSLESIFEEVIKSEEGRAMNLERVRCSLDQLHFCSEADDVYSVSLKDIIKKVQLEEVESIVLKRYGNGAFRIFRSLSTGRALDTDKIAEKTLMDKKETPQILYRLWKDSFLQMEKITTGAPKQKDFILWTVKKDNVWQKVLDELYHAALNLSLRCAHELEGEREIRILVGKDKIKSQELTKKLDRFKQITFQWFLFTWMTWKLLDAILDAHLVNPRRSTQLDKPYWKSARRF